MARLDLATLTCIKTEDVLGADECELKIFADGQLARRIASILGQGQTLNLGSNQIPFSGALRIVLHDTDNPAVGDQHDLLGDQAISSATTAGSTLNFVGAGAKYALSYAVSSFSGASIPAGPAYLMVISETGVPHSACLFRYPNDVEKWFGFKPIAHLSPFGPGFVDTASRLPYLNHSITFEASERDLISCEAMIGAKYGTATYQLGVLDCVSLSADVARICQLRVANANFTPFGFISYLREYNTFVNYT